MGRHYIPKIRERKDSHKAEVCPHPSGVKLTDDEEICLTCGKLLKIKQPSSQPR